jgi:hypothetical protein
MRGRIFRHFFEDLFAGDPVALTVAGVLLFFGLLIGFVWIKSARELREDDKKKKKGGGKR